MGLNRQLAWAFLLGTFGGASFCMTTTTTTTATTTTTQFLVVDAFSYQTNNVVARPAQMNTPSRQGHARLWLSSPSSSSSSDSFEETMSSSSSSSTSVDFAMDPSSKEALQVVKKHLGLSLQQHQKLAALAVLVVDWNSRINLISRRDCTKAVVFGRHILPSLSILGMEGDDAVLPRQQPQPQPTNGGADASVVVRVVDVGTGGGFPGLPLAIAYPHCEFLLVDSVGKKLTAVQDMADRLGLTNVRTHHGRAEVLAEQEHDFDVCVGRSVAAIPTYCFWTQKLLKKDTGRLAYMLGGDIDQDLSDQAIVDRPIDELLQCPGASDKRVLVFPQKAVEQIAAKSGDKIRVPTLTQQNKAKAKPKRAKGQWTPRDNSAPKQRGYESFKRFDSLNPPSS